MTKILSKVTCIEICDVACMLQVFLALEQAVELLTVALQNEKKRKKTKEHKISLIYNWYFLI